MAKEYLQTYGLDFHDSFAPVAKVVTVRLLLAIATHKHLFLHHPDINNAFLHDYLEDDVYLIPPLDLEVEFGKVCKLIKALYGLK